MSEKIRSPYLSKEDCSTISSALRDYIESLEKETDAMEKKVPAGENSYAVFLCREAAERCKRIKLRCDEFANQKG